MKKFKGLKIKLKKDFRKYKNREIEKIDGEDKKLKGPI